MALLALLIARVSAIDYSSNGHSVRGAYSNFDGHVRYFNDYSGNTVPATLWDENNDGINDIFDSNRDGKVDQNRHGYHGHNNGYQYTNHYHDNYRFHSYGYP